MSDTRYTIQTVLPRNVVLSGERSIVERFFCRLKHFRPVATHDDKRAAIYLATMLLASMALFALLT